MLSDREELLRKSTNPNVKTEVEPKKISHTLLEDLITGQEEMIVELQKLNKNLVIVGQALIKMAEKPVKGKKAVDTR